MRVRFGPDRLGRLGYFAAPMQGFEGLEEREHAGLDELEQYLSTAPALTWGEAVLEGGHPEKHRILLAGGVQVMAKPGFDQFEGVARRESAGWKVARHLGFSGLVAGTVLRQVPRLSTGIDVLSSIQVTWPDGREWLTPIDRLPPDEVWQAAVFDAVVAHADHGNNNWFGVPHPSAGREQHLRLVDTGNAFGVGGDAVNSSFYQHHLDDVLPVEVIEALGRLIEHWPATLEDLLGADEAARTRQRAERLLDSQTLRVG